MSRNQEQKSRMLDVTFNILEQKLQDTKNRLSTVGQEIGESGGTNDFHDNFAFEQAMRDFDMVHAQLGLINNLLSSAEIINPENNGCVGYGNTVHIKFEDEELEQVIIGTSIDVVHGNQKNMISDESPLGKAILGHKVGETIQVQTPGGLIEATIESIS